MYGPKPPTVQLIKLATSYCALGLFLFRMRFWFRWRPRLLTRNSVYLTYIPRVSGWFVPPTESIFPPLRTL